MDKPPRPNETERLPGRCVAGVPGVSGTSNHVDTDDGYPRNSSVIEVFKRQVARGPERIAVADSEQSLRYLQLDRLSDGVAGALVDAGITAGERVGICMDRSFELIVSTLAILKAGAVYVPLAPSDPPARLRQLVAHSELKRVLVCAGGVERPDLGPTLAVDLEEAADSPHAGCFSPVGRAAMDPAYLMYTSGSTGEPNGCLIPHRGIVRLVKNTNYLPFSDDLVILNASSPAFDASTFEIWGALLNAAQVAILRESIPTVRGLRDAIRCHQVTTCWLTAGLFNLVVDEAVEILAPLRHVLTGGDVASPEHFHRFRQACPHVALINGYGPTENTTFSTCFRVEDVPAPDRPVPIGKPISHSTAYVLDGDLNPLPQGTAGELYLGGDGVALGYWKRPDLDRERFVPDPFSAEAGARLYRSGDLARLLPEGSIEFLGRRDRQVKIRGFRVELDEIELVANACPAVEQAVVLARPKPSGGKELYGYVRGRASSDELIGHVQSFLAARMPAHMLPSRWTAVDGFPLTANGKVDRARLAASDSEVPARWGEDVPLATEMEARVAAIWRSVLAVPHVGPADNFFSLGGDSLLAIHTTFRIGEDVGVELPLEALFDQPRLRDLARLLERGQYDKQRSAEQTKRAPLPRLPRNADGPTVLPATSIQRRFCFLQRFDPGSSAYLVYDLWRIRGDLDAAVLDESIDALIRRHEILRTHFEFRDGAFQQVIPRTASRPLERVDLTDRPPADRERSARDLCHRFASTPIPLDDSVLARFLLVQSAPDDHRLLVVFHHAITDGWGLQVFYRELSETYSRLRCGEALPQDALEEQFADVAAAIEAATSPDMRERARRFWLESMRPPPVPLRIPPDDQPAAVSSIQGSKIFAHIAARRRAEIKQAAARQGVTPFVWLLACYCVFLKRRCRTDDLVIGTPVACRDLPCSEGQIGPFINLLALRIDGSGEPTFSELLQRIWTTVHESLRHRAFPYEELVAELRAIHSDPRAPVCRVLFACQNYEDASFQLEGSVVARENLHNGASPYDLTLFVFPDNDRYRIECEYDPGLYRRGTCELLVRAFLAIIENSLVDPVRTINDRTWFDDETGVASPADEPAISAAPHARESIDRSLAPDRPTKGEGDTEPPSLLEDKLLEIWRRILDREEIGCRDSFFDLGGDSLAAVRLVVQLERELGYTLPLNELFSHPTIRDLARRLKGQTAGTGFRSLVPLRLGGKRPPLYLVHGHGGDVFGFLPLARCLGPDQPVYGLQAIELSGGVEPYASIEEAASHYITEILRFQPEGPYQLAGYSLGGMIAFEMAHQLAERGIPVSFLGIIDTVPSNLPKAINWQMRSSYLWVRLFHHAARVLKQHPTHTAAYTRGRFAALRHHLLSGRRLVQQDSAPSTGDTRMCSYYERLFYGYKPTPTPVAVCLFHAIEKGMNIEAAWKYLASGGVRVHRFPCEHLKLLDESYAGHLAEAFEKELNS